jgi:tetratricopeptide (TPR) repeat protein
VRERFDAPEVRYDLGLAHLRLAEIDRELGNFPAAQDSATKAIALLGALADAHPDAADYPRDLAAAYVTLGLIHSDSARWDEAEAAYRKAIAIQERQHAAHADSAQYRYALAKALNTSGFTFGRADRPDNAAARYRQALEVLKRADAKDTASPEHRSLLAETHMNLGMVSVSKGRYDEGEASLKEGIRLYKELVQGRPDARPEDWQALGRSLAFLGRAYNQTNRLEEAEEVQQQALTIFETLAREHPDVQVFAYDLGRCYQELGFTADKRGRPADARARYDQALRILEDVQSKGYRAAHRVILVARIARATTFTLEGDHARAVEEAEALARQPELTPVHVYDIACLYARSVPVAGRDPKLAPAEQGRMKQHYADRAYRQAMS